MMAITLASPTAVSSDAEQLLESKRLYLCGQLIIVRWKDYEGMDGWTLDLYSKNISTDEIKNLYCLEAKTNST